jgi:hypothetical protein
MSTVVGVFALETGLVVPVEPETLVRIVSRNTGLRVRARIPVRDGSLRTEGDYHTGAGGRFDGADFRRSRPTPLSTELSQGRREWDRGTDAGGYPLGPRGDAQ